VPEVFVSHVDADSVAARQLAEALEAAGFPAWAGRAGDGDAGAALAASKVVVLLASPDALGSARMTEEVVAAYERGKPFVPVLTGISHVELSARQPAWRTAIGAATAIDVPPEGVAPIAGRVVAGVRALTAPAPRSPGARSRVRRGGLLVGAVLVVLGAAAVWWTVVRDSGADDGTPGSSSTASPGATGTGSAVADSTTTPLKTVAGDLLVMQTGLTNRFCAVEPDCVEATGTDRLVVVSLRDPSWRRLDFTSEFSSQMAQSYVEYGKRKATYVLAWQDTISGIWDIAYTALPAEAISGDVRIVWPGNPPLALHPVVPPS
jgi:hypothetical protein